MNAILRSPSRLDRARAAVLALVGTFLIVWAVKAWYVLAFAWIAGLFALAVLGIVVVALWCNGLRWFFSRGALRFHAWLWAGCLTAIVFYYAEESWRGKRAWASRLREAEAQGERLSLASLLLPEPPADQNLVQAPVFTRLREIRLRDSSQEGTTDAIGPDAIGWPRQRTTDFAAWNRCIRRGMTNAAPASADTNEAASELLELLRPYEPLLAELAQTSRQRPFARLPHVADDWHILWPPRGETDFGWRGTARALILRASARLARRETDAALADALLAVRITDVLEGEPYLFQQGIRWRLLLTSLQPVWEGLAARCWSEPQLAVLQARLARIDLRPDSITALRGERAIYLTLMDGLIRFKETGVLPEKRKPKDPAERALWWLVRRLLPAGWLYQAKAQWYDDFERGLSAWAANSNRVAIVHKTRLTIAAWNDPFYPVYVAPRVQMVFEDAARDVAWAQTALNEAVTACALERYRLKEGHYPSRLEDLVPRWLAHVPTGLVDGKPLGFELSGDGAPALRAAGWGEPASKRASSSAYHIDDPLSWHFVQQSEWVWRYPEKPAPQKP